MIRLIKIEWSKFRKNNVVVLLATFFCLFMPISLYFLNVLPDLPVFLPSKGSFFQFPSIWSSLGYSGNWMSFFFLGVLAIYLISIEINNKTLRQSIINGLSRQEYFLSKVLSIAIISLIATLFYALVAIVFGSINTEALTLTAIFDNDWAILRFFLMTFGYLSFALFVAFLIRRSGIAIFLYISYGIIIEVIIRYTIIEKVSSNGITNYFPLNVFEDLMPNPAFAFAESIPNNIDFEYVLSYTEAAGFSVLYIIIFLGLSYWSFLRRDM